MRHLSRENLFRGANNFCAFCCHSRNTGASPFLLRYVSWVLLRALHNTHDLQLYIPSNGYESIMVKCLAQGHKPLRAEWAVQNTYGIALPNIFSLKRF